MSSRNALEQLFEAVVSEDDEALVRLFEGSGGPLFISLEVDEFTPEQKLLFMEPASLLIH